MFNTLNSELNPICHMLALLGAHHILHVSRIRVNSSPTESQNFYFFATLIKHVPVVPCLSSSV